MARPTLLLVGFALPCELLAKSPCRHRMVIIMIHVAGRRG